MQNLQEEATWRAPAWRGAWVQAERQGVQTHHLLTTDQAWSPQAEAACGRHVSRGRAGLVSLPRKQQSPP